MTAAVPTHPAETVNAIAAAHGWPTHCAGDLVFDEPELNALAALWRSKAAGKPAPYRRDLDARALKPVLRRITLTERVHEDGHRRFRHRLMGSEIASLFGENTGLCIDEVVPAQFLDRWHIPYDAVLDSCRPMRILSHYDHPKVDYLSGENFLAPLLDAEGQPTIRKREGEAVQACAG